MVVAILLLHHMYEKDIIMMNLHQFVIFMKDLIWKVESKLFLLVFIPLMIWKIMEKNVIGVHISLQDLQ